MFGKTKLATLVAEFFGATALTSVVLAVTNSQLGFPLFVAASAGTVVGLLILLVGKNSGAHVNPAVTLGLWSVKKIETTQAIAYIAVQLLGGLVALTLFQYLTGRELPKAPDAAFAWPVFWAEVVGAFIFCFGWMSAVAQKYEGLTLALTAGAVFAAGVVVASVASNGFLNPAVAIGMRSISRTTLFAPVVGSLVGMNLYHYLFVGGKAKK